MPYLLFLKKQQNLKLSSSAKIGGVLMVNPFPTSHDVCRLFFCLFVFLCSLYCKRYCLRSDCPQGRFLILLYRAVAERVYSLFFKVVIALFNISHAFGQNLFSNGFRSSIIPNAVNLSLIFSTHNVTCSDSLWISVVIDFRRMAENGFAPPRPLGNFADISYLVENWKPSLLRDVCTLCSGALVCKSL